jgi:2-polyprenyl-3-methyl-5-hydroxy-6-metoxy-1,4-benzoquinol methylase
MKKSLLNDDTAQYLKKVDYTRTWSVAHHMRFLMFAHHIVSNNIKSVLDVGFGQDMLVRYLDDAGYTGKYVGIDMNPEYVDAANHSFGTEFPSVHIEGGLEVVEGMEFDCVVLGEVIEHIEKDKAVEFMASCKSLLRSDGGSILLSTPNKIDGKLNWPDDHDDEFSYDELISVFGQSGFTVLGEYGLWNNTAHTMDLLSQKEKDTYIEYVQVIPNSLLNVFFNLQHVKESRAILFVLGHNTYKPS